MSPAPAAAAMAAGKTGAAKGGLAWVNAHPGQTAALAGGFLGLIVLMRARGAKAGGGPLGYVMPPSTGAPGAVDLLSSVEGEIGNLAQQLATTPPTQNVPAPASPTAEQAAFMQWVADHGPSYPGGQAKLVADLAYIGSLPPDQQQALARLGGH